MLRCFGAAVGVALCWLWVLLPGLKSWEVVDTFGRARNFGEDLLKHDFLSKCKVRLGSLCREFANCSKKANHSLTQKP